MQRTQIKTGDVLAHRRGKYGSITKAVVLTTEPVTPSNYRGWGYGNAENHDITLPDGTTVNVPFKLAKEAHKRADKLVLVKLQSFKEWEAGGRTPVYEDRITAVPARDLIGYYDEEKAKEDAAKEAATKASNERARVRREQYDQYAALRERAQALVPEADLAEAPNARISIDRASLDALLELAEKYADLSNS